MCKNYFKLVYVRGVSKFVFKILDFFINIYKIFFLIILVIWKWKKFIGLKLFYGNYFFYLKRKIELKMYNEIF